MSIFQFYPKVAYKVDNVDYIKAIDITTSIKIKDFFKTYRGISFNPYVVKDGERPDYVSFKAYGTPMYDWIVLLVNEIYNKLAHHQIDTDTVICQLSLLEIYPTKDFLRCLEKSRNSDITLNEFVKALVSSDSNLGENMVAGAVNNRVQVL